MLNKCNKPIYSIIRNVIFNSKRITQIRDSSNNMLFSPHIRVHFIIIIIFFEKKNKNLSIWKVNRIYDMQTKFHMWNALYDSYATS